MITIDCSELSNDEQLALASEVSDQLDGRAIALAKGDKVVLDQLGGDPVGVGEVRGVVDGFLSRRENASSYSVTVLGDQISVHSPYPAAARGRRNRANDLPPNLKQCPYCSFVTPYEEMYVVHTRSHFFTV